MTKTVPLKWNFDRLIGSATYEISDDGTEVLLDFQIDDPEIEKMLFPDRSDHLSLAPACLPRY